MARIFSGIQPSGELHVGNYFGALTNWSELQEENDCIYSIVDLHAITSDYDPENLRDKSVDLAMNLIACGIDPEESLLFIQSDVPEHTELTWFFNVVTSYGDLTRMTQFKQKSEKADFVNAGLFNYPVLQAADILLYRASKVPVGEDQLQHLELSRRIARRFNNTYEDFFPEPEPIVGEGARIMSPADPENKMSKSSHSKHRIGIMESPDSIREKIRSAVTDPGLEEGKEKSPGVANLFEILELTAGEEVVEEFEEDFRAGELMYSDLKDAVSASLIDTLKPIQEKKERLKENPGRVREILDRGRERAREIAVENMEEVRRLMGVRS